MATSTVASLPEEILVQIISFLDVDPPSKQKLRFEPNERIFDSDVRPLKHLSTTTRQLRRLTLPVLFRYVRIDVTPTDEDCPPLAGPYECIVNATRSATATAQTFLEFAKRLDLCSHVTSVLVYLRDYLDHPYCMDRPDPSVLNLSCFWNTLLHGLGTERIVILATLSDMLWLTACTRTPDYRDYTAYKATPDLKYQVLELYRDRAVCIPPSDSTYGFATKASGPYRVSSTSVLFLRKWTHVSLNEGSFLGAYGTLDWFERGAPNNTPSMLGFLFPGCCRQHRTYHTHRFGRLASGLTSMESFSYTAMFPPMDHLLQLDNMSGVHHFHHLRKLSLQIAPHQEELGRILNQSDRVGRADLGECWEHVQSTYLKLRQLLATSIHTDHWRLKAIVCEDTTIEGLNVDLRERFEDIFKNAVPAVGDEWKGWGKFWRIIDASDGPTIAISN